MIHTQESLERLTDDELNDVAIKFGWDDGLAPNEGTRDIAMKCQVVFDTPNLTREEKDELLDTAFRRTGKIEYTDDGAKVTAFARLFLPCSAEVMREERTRWILNVQHQSIRQIHTSEERISQAIETLGFDPRINSEEKSPD